MQPWLVTLRLSTFMESSLNTTSTQERGNSMAAKRASGTLAVAWFSCKSFHNNIQSLATGSGGESVAYVTPKIGAACSPTSNAAPSFPNEPEDPNVAKALREFCHQ